MTAELRGLPAAPGVASGAPWVYRPPAGAAGPRRPIAEAARQAARELDGLAQRLHRQGRAEESEILSAQALMATDEELLGPARQREASGDDPVEALLQGGEAVAAGFEALGDEVLAARAADVRDVSARIARHVTGASPPRLERRSIVVAGDLAPSVTVELDRTLLAGIALEGGSRTSHAAILARALEIPAVVGVAGLVQRAAGARELAIDGGSGVVVLEPDADARARLAHAAAEAEVERTADDEYRSRALTTSDGHRVVCAANIGDPAEAVVAFDAGAEAIGLFRTEFAFAGRRSPPPEEHQAAAYERVLRAAAGAPVVVRLADIGGDKPLPYLPVPSEANPFLGERALRLAGRHPELFPTQLRAILRASAAVGRPASIMSPMVADAGDVALLHRLVDDARAAVPDAPAPRVGIMVEIPSAVLLADELSGQVDFMSIGTNDLTAYLLAADRTNPALAARQDPLHPAVLRAVARVVEGARRGQARCDVAVCGEMAGEAAGALLLIGLGVDELSMDPTAFNRVKRAVCARTLTELEGLASRALRAASAAEVRAMVAAA